MAQARARAGTIALIVLSLPVLVGVFVYAPFILDLFLHRRPPSRFLIPSGYVGWARIEYRIPGAAPLAREGKYLLVRLDKVASLQTSSDLPEGWAHDQFLYYVGNTRQPLSNAGWCKGGMIWGVATGTEPGPESAILSEKFFVGTETQFRHEVDPSGKNFSPCE